MTVQYKQIALSVPANQKLEQEILAGTANLTRTIRLIGTTTNLLGALLTLRNAQTTIAEIPTSANMGYGYWYPIDLTLAADDQIYIGIDNKSSNAVGSRVAIAYEEAPTTGH